MPGVEAQLRKDEPSPGPCVALSGRPSALLPIGPSCTRVQASRGPATPGFSRLLPPRIAARRRPIAISSGKETGTLPFASMTGRHARPPSTVGEPLRCRSGRARGRCMQRVVPRGSVHHTIAVTLAFSRSRRFGQVRFDSSCVRCGPRATTRGGCDTDAVLADGSVGTGMTRSRLRTLSSCRAFRLGGSVASTRRALPARFGRLSPSAASRERRVAPPRGKHN